MVIAINSRVLTERRGGPARYTVNVIRELAKKDRSNTYYLLFNRDYSFDFTLPPNFRQVLIRTGSRVIFDYVIIPVFSWFHRIDVFLFPKNTFSPMVRGRKIPVYHDIIYFEKEFKFREHRYFDNLHHKIMIPIAAKLSAMDLTVSDFTASRMRRLLRIKPEKIRIVKEGVENVFRRIDDKGVLEGVVAKHGLKRPFFFYAGSLSPRKNMVATLKAFDMIRERIPHNIYFTASESWHDGDVYRTIDELKLGDRVFKLGYLSDSDLVAMYNLADCYLYPSLYEGFGLPILEAQACGCPLITSSQSSCPEVAGEGAVLVNPYDIASMAEAMLAVVGDRNLRRRIVEKGRDNCRRYSWEHAAARILDLFEEVHRMR